MKTVIRDSHEIQVYPGKKKVDSLYFQQGSVAPKMTFVIGLRLCLLVLVRTARDRVSALMRMAFSASRFILTLDYVSHAYTQGQEEERLLRRNKACQMWAHTCHGKVVFTSCNAVRFLIQQGASFLSDFILNQP